MPHAHHTEMEKKNPREVKSYGWKEGERMLVWQRAKVLQNNHNS